MSNKISCGIGRTLQTEPYEFIRVDIRIEMDKPDDYSEKRLAKETEKLSKFVENSLTKITDRLMNEDDDIPF